MKKQLLSVLVLSSALLAACNSGGSGSSDDGVQTNLTTTVTFAFNNFTGVSVVGPFSVSIVPGPYSISVTVDSGLHRRLDVREEGQILVVEFEAGSQIVSQTMDVRIAMPTLESTSLANATFATISDFNGSLLEVWLAGAAMLEGQNVSYDLVMASVDAASVLAMEDANPLPAADIRLSAASSANVNMLDHGVLTGAATSASTLGYYGTNVSISVATDSTSSVVQLGPSRP